ncbi:MAG TPA: UPF0149 family protein [Gammaproteobacteria bacterium]|nr:UPF0149 family protein [Gammaproteobacteria bacterium]
MSEISFLPNYSELNAILQKTQPNSNIAQVHGLLCGLICATSGNKQSHWEKLILGDKKSKKTQDTLRQLYETSYHQLSEFSFEFALVLPDDNIDINIRAEALGLWCQGFLTGLENTDIHVKKNQLPAEVIEALDDLTEIAQINFGDMATNEEDETAYFELIEYVRLAVLMIYHELKSDPSETAKNDDENDLMH